MLDSPYQIFTPYESEAALFENFGHEPSLIVGFLDQFEIEPEIEAYWANRELPDGPCRVVDDYAYLCENRTPGYLKERSPGQRSV